MAHASLIQTLLPPAVRPGPHLSHRKIKLRRAFKNRASTTCQVLNPLFHQIFQQPQETGPVTTLDEDEEMGATDQV